MRQKEGKHEMKRMITTVVLAAAMLLGTAASALAFEPPADPQDKFTSECGDPISAIKGHPGFTGQETAIFEAGNTVGAWNATEDGGSNSGGKSAVTLYDPACP